MGAAAGGALAGGRVIYRLFRALWRAALLAFFRRIGVQGRENVPARGPVLLASNHVNAFVDPLLILTRVERPLSLTAKSTLRKNPLLRPLIAALNVVELHRSQDVGEGADPAKNADALAECRRRLAEGGAVVVFPEGVSHSDPALRPFRTGAARIALDYVDSADPAIGRGEPLMLVPVGLHYDEKDRPRSDAGVVFGEAMDVRAWRRARPDGDARELTEEIEARIRALTTNFEAGHEIPTFARAAELLACADVAPAPLGRETAPDVAARVALVHRLQAGRAWLARERPGELSALEARIDALYAELARLGITAPELFLPMEAGRAAFFVFREMELLLVGAPLAAWGWIHHAPGYAVLRRLVRKMSTDRDHVASNAVFVGIPLFAVFYLAQTAIVGLVTGSIPGAVLYLLSLPYTGAVALLWRDRAGGARRRARTFLYFRRRPEAQRRLAAEARAVADDIRRLGAGLEAGSAA